MAVRPWLLLAFFGAATFLRAAHAEERPLSAYDRVEIAPTKTSIYIGTIHMSFPVFVREAGTYSAPYSAKVFPFFFYNEKGTLFIDIDDATLRRLERGEPIDFTGHGVNAQGEMRRVEGRATPLDLRSGKIKVRVFVTKKIQLVFNTSYRFVTP